MGHEGPSTSKKSTHPDKNEAHRHHHHRKSHHHSSPGGTSFGVGEKSKDRTASQENFLKERGYVLQDMMAEGSQSLVYRAEFNDSRTFKKITLACKLIDEKTSPKEYVRKFLPRELELYRKVNHVNVVRLHGIVTYKSRHYVFMQYAQNGNLLEFLRQNGAIMEGQAKIWFYQLLKGVEYLHIHGIAHRDIKCENLLLNNSYTIKISDFGFARYTEDAQGKPVMSNTFCGSIAYCAPEILDATRYDCKLADLWSVGVVLYAMVNKQLPFDETNIKKMLEAQKGRIWNLRPKYASSISNDLKKFLQLLLEPVPERRLKISQMYGDRWLSPMARRDTATDAVAYPAQITIAGAGRDNVIDVHEAPSLTRIAK